MSIFRRRKADLPANAAGAIGEFWAWWADEGAARTAAAIDDGSVKEMVEPLSRWVLAVGDGLSWELGPGRASRHVLVVTAAGNPDMRAKARRWRMAAPAADPTWEYSDVKLAAADPSELTFEVDGHRVGVADAVVGVEVEGAVIHVRVFHPGFPVMPADVRDHAAFLLLDCMLGEADVELWIGEIASSTTAIPEAMPLTALPDVVARVRTEYTDADGDPAWIVMGGESPDGEPVMASAQVPLRPMIAPHLDTHVAVIVPFTDRTSKGLPGEGSLSRLRDLEDHVAALLLGSGRVVAHQTHAGTRVLHVYVDSTTPAVEQLRAGVVGWDQGATEIHPQHDPGWEGVAHLRG